MPSRQTFYEWIQLHPEAGDKYARAKRDSADFLAEQIQEIADAPVPKDEFGKTDSGAVQDKRVRIDARKWIAAKLKPKKYSERTILAGDEDNPIKTASELEVRLVDKIHTKKDD